jgi:hypothetical protein
MLFEFQVLSFICNTYCIVLFVLGFEAPLRRCLWLMMWRQHWPIAGYLRVGRCKLRWFESGKSHNPKVHILTLEWKK